MEIAILTQLGLINDKTIFVSTCHDCQLFDENLSKIVKFDVNDAIMDYIITPTKIIKVDKEKYNNTEKNYFIDWKRLNNDRIKNIPILQTLYRNQFGYDYRAQNSQRQNPNTQNRNLRQQTQRRNGNRNYNYQRGSHYW